MHQADENLLERALGGLQIAELDAEAGQAPHQLGNAGLLAAMILALGDAKLATRVTKWRQAQTKSVALEPQA